MRKDSIHNDKTEAGEKLPHKEMSRTEARELLMKLLFQMNSQKDYSDPAKMRFIGEYVRDDAQLGYFEELLLKITSNIETIDDQIETCSEHWKINRIDEIDLAILRLSAGEILYMDDIPDSASINEAVELAKKYGSSNSSKFINGILGKVARSKND